MMGDNFDDLKGINPFGDPSVIQATTNAKKPAPDISVGGFPSTNFNNATEFNASTGFQTEIDDYKRQNEELRLRLEEAKRREELLANKQQSGVKPPNFPPFPSFLPFQPCFYINIDEEIPLHHNMLFYSILLLANIFVLMFHFGSDVGSPTVSFIISIIMAAIIIPLSFLCTFRSAYIALKSNSSFYFIFYLLSEAIEIIFHIAQTLGFPGNSWGGFINGASLVDKSHSFSGGLTILFGFLWLGLLLVSGYLGFQMYKVYKLSGANIQQAQQEFTAGVWKKGGAQLLTSAIQQTT